MGNKASDGSFVKDGFLNLKKKVHVGASSSTHNQAQVHYELFKNKKQRMAFRGYDESEDSNNQENFLELLYWLYVRDSFSSILVYESRDISVKEQMSVVVRYVKNVCLLKIFIGVIHVSSIIAASIKAAINQLFSMYRLSISNLKGQGYDGASNMRKYPKIKTFFTTVHKLVNFVERSAKRSNLIREN
ncbi:uncharacterized protein LOC111411309 [Olea europaea var. sylvestris]|uniref:uncharacterized protein LOC111411309 n=1 Tax=Olea europaea var. sylvestris TaxID=158386 RepID=UPI000C1D2BA5|nr:uncharacterized protein LOC111411309 [Olea europaea var. sylvestris]